MELINQHLIRTDAALNNKKAIFETICDLLDAEDRLLDRQLYLNDVCEREELEPTALGFSFAIPHAKSKGVKTASLVFISLRNEIFWTDTEKVKYIFGIAVPYEKAGDEHLKILSMLARKMISDEFRNELMAAKTKEDYLALIKQDTAE